MPIPEKLKCSIYICCFDINKKINIELMFSKDYFTINFLEPLKDENLKEIKGIFAPFLSKNNQLIKINYIFIKSIYIDCSNLLTFNLYNPITISIIPIIFNNCKYKKSLFYSELNLPVSMLSSIKLDINTKIKYITKKKINDFLIIINLLYQFISTERKYNAIIEDLFLKAFNFGINYYNKCCKEFINKDKKIKEIIDNDMAKKIDKFIIKIKKESENNIIEKIKKVNKSSSSIEDEDEEKSKDKKMEIIDKMLINNGIDTSKFNSSIFSALGINSNIKRDLFQNYAKIKKFLNDIKINTSYFSEITINLIFKMLNIDKNDLNNKYDLLNKTEIGYTININNNNQLKSPLYEPTDINFNHKNNNDLSYMKGKNSFENLNNFIKKYYSDEDSSKQNNDKYINELLDFSKDFHSFLPNNSHLNIIYNTSQLIHRKFFQLLLKKYFSDIMDIETEKNKVLEPDPFHQILRVLRKLKKILFTIKNQNYYSDYLFLHE